MIIHPHMNQERDISKNDKSFNIKEIFLEMFFTYVEGNIDLPFVFSNSLNKRLPSYIHCPSFTIIQALSAEKLSAFLFCFEAWLLLYETEGGADCFPFPMRKFVVIRLEFWS